jgi:hypothetical protein
MRIKRKKKILIGDTVFNIRWDKETGGGSFAYPTITDPAEIVIGTMYARTNPVIILSILIHELKEIIQVEQSVRVGADNAYYEFHYSHKEHTDLCSRLVGLLTEFIDQ